MKIIHQLGLLITLSALSGCSAIGAIFKGGMWFGIFLVAGVIALILFLLGRTKK